MPYNSIPAHVLLVDDQPANLLALEAVLDTLGVNLVRAVSGPHRTLLEAGALDLEAAPGAEEAQRELQPEAGRVLVVADGARVLAFANVVTALVAAWFVFHVPFRGSITLLLIESIIYSMVSLAVGVLVASVTPTQRVAMLVALLATMLQARSCQEWFSRSPAPGQP